MDVHVKRGGTPVTGAIIKIIWNGEGESNGTTDENGLFQTGGSGGDADKVFVDGQLKLEYTFLSHSGVTIVLDNDD